MVSICYTGINSHCLPIWGKHFVLRAAPGMAFSLNIFFCLLECLTPLLSQKRVHACICYSTLEGDTIIIRYKEKSSPTVASVASSVRSDYLQNITISEEDLRQPDKAIPSSTEHTLCPSKTASCGYYGGGCTGGLPYLCNPNLTADPWMSDNNLSMLTLLSWRAHLMPYSLNASMPGIPSRTLSY